MVDRLVDPSGAPPLSTWLISVILAIISMVGFWFWVGAPSERVSPFINSGYCELDLTGIDAGKGPSIIAIGSSLLGYAAEPKKKLESILQGIQFQLCWVNGGNWSNLVSALPAIVARKPNVLLLHEGVLVETWGGENEPYSIQDVVKDVTQKVRRILKLKPQLKQQFSQTLCQVWKARELSTSIDILSPRASIFADATVWLRRLQAAGTHVILLDIPRSSELESQLGMSLVQRRAALQKLASDSGAEYWSFIPPANSNAFCPDQAHMTLLGRDQFAPQLANRLRRYFAGSPR